MNTKDKFSLDTVWKFCIFILLFFSAFIALFFTYYSTFYSYYPPMTDPEIFYTVTYLIHDSWFTNLAAFFIAVGLTFLWEFILKKFPLWQKKASYLFLAVCCLLFFIVGCYWTMVLPYYPSGDQINTTAAAHYNLTGNFSMFQKGGYIGIYSQQKGLVFIYEILFTLFGHFSYNIIEKFYVFSGVLVMIFGFLFLKEVSERYIYRYIYCMCILFCAPYIILMPYAYGDIPSICFCVIMFWALQRFSKTMQKRYVVISCFCAILALFNRQNSWIVLIAVAISLCLLALEKRSIRPIIAGACILISAALSVQILNYSYEIRSGYEDTKGTPASLYFAMGMQEGHYGPGTYNRFNQGTYQSVDFDREAAAKLGWEEFQNRIDIFRMNPEYAVDFYKAKLQLQWIEPLFETLISTDSFDDDAEIPDLIENIYHGEYHDKLFNLADAYQSVVYLSFLAYVVALFKRQYRSIDYLPLITLVGGFLFSIIWEAQGRYVLPYYVFMLVYIPIGLCSVCDAIAWLFNKLPFVQKKLPARDTEQEDSAAA